MNENKIPININLLSDIKKLIPKSDFIDQQYDTDEQTPIKKVLIVLSTPRSGSTFFCDILFNCKICLAHEYLQTEQYLPVLANRWQCITNCSLDKKKFIEELSRYRTSKEGILGINIHGSHIGTDMV